MRGISANILTLVNQPEIEYFYCVEIVASGPNGWSWSKRDTSYTSDISINGYTYLANNGLAAVDPPRQSSVVDRESYKISYLDPEFLFRSIFEAGVIGASVHVFSVFINKTQGILGDANPGNPLVNSEDTITVYKGIVDTHGYTTNDGGDVIVSIEGASPMASLGMTKVMITSPDSVKQRSSGDTSYDKVLTGSRDINLLWGKP